MKNILKVLAAVAVLAVVAVTVRASDPSPLASGVFPTYNLQTWVSPNGTVVGYVDPSGNLYVKGLITGTTGAVVTATMPLSIAFGGTGATNVVAIKTALGYQGATGNTGASTNYTWTFSPAYSVAPRVVASPNQNVTVWASSITTSNAVFATTATNVTLYLWAHGAP